MTTIHHVDASRRVLAFAAENRLIQGRWEKEEDGRHLACLLGSAWSAAWPKQASRLCDLIDTALEAIR